MNIIPMLAHLVVSAGAILLVAKVAPGFKVRDFQSAVIAALAIGIANAILRPILVFFTFPFIVVTLGLFTFVVDAIVLKVCARFVTGFAVEGWGAAIVAAFLLAVANAGLHALLI
jgi:putative membrane protein